MTPDGEIQCREVPRFTFDFRDADAVALIECQLPAGHPEALHADLYIAKDGTRTEVRWRRL